MKRPKIYTRKVHLWLTEKQFATLEQKSKGLLFGKIELVRNYIERKSPYLKFYTNVDFKLARIRDLMNQIAKHYNNANKYRETVSEKLITDRMEEIFKLQNEIKTLMENKR